MNSLSLPDLSSEKPSYNITIPSTKETATYQSYTKEQEKAILIASQEENFSSLVPTLMTLLNTHCSTDIKTVVDFMYTLTHIRVKSHGGTQTFTVKKCECGKENIEIKVENILDYIKIKNENVLKKTFKLTDAISLRLCPTKIDMLNHISFEDTPENAMNQIYNLIAYSVDYVVKDEQIIKDFTTDELIEKMIKHLSPKQIEDINKEIGELINVCFEIKYCCSNCKEEFTKEISDFLLLN